MLSVRDLSKSFGPIKAVDRVSFTALSGKITIIAGADGAGKSTIFKIILGLIKKDKGDIFVKDNPVDGNFSRVTDITGYMPERFSLYTDLTVEENMDFFADIQKVEPGRKRELKNRLLERTGMLPFRKRRAGALSGGMKQKLALSTILLSSPDILILDEPTTGVDPLSRIEFFKIMDDLKKEGKTIVMATPYLDEAEKGDFIVFIRKGKNIKQGAIKEIKDNFPEKMFRILPAGNIFETLNELNSKKEIRAHFYVKGRYIKCLFKGDSDFLATIKADEIREEKPSLEDIYLYYERGVGDD